MHPAGEDCSFSALTTEKSCYWCPKDALPLMLPCWWLRFPIWILTPGVVKRLNWWGQQHFVDALLISEIMQIMINNESFVRRMASLWQARSVLLLHILWSTDSKENGFNPIRLSSQIPSWTGGFDWFFWANAKRNTVASCDQHSVLALKKTLPPRVPRLDIEGQVNKTWTNYKGCHHVAAGRPRLCTLLRRASPRELIY